MYLVQEKCECELGQFLAKQANQKLAETACQNVIRQTAQAMRYKNILCLNYEQNKELAGLDPIEANIFHKR